MRAAFERCRCSSSWRCLFSFAGHSPASAAAIKRISQDVGAKIRGELFSDAMGTPGQIENGYDLGTYEGMIKHNVNKVVEALK